MNTKQIKLLKYAHAALGNNNPEAALEFLDMVTASDADLPGMLQATKEKFIKIMNSMTQSPVSADTFGKLVTIVSDTLELMSYYSVEGNTEAKVKEVQKLLNSKFPSYVPKQTVKPVEKEEEAVEEEEEEKDEKKDKEVEEEVEEETKSEVEVKAEDPDGYIVNDSEVLECLFSWHGGQGSAIYSLASSSNAGRTVPKSVLENAISEVEKDVKWLDAKPSKRKQDKQDLAELQDTLDYLEALRDGKLDE